MLTPAVSRKRISFLDQTAILLMLIAVAIMIFLCAYKWVISQNSMISPQEMELKRLTKMVESSPNNPAARLALAYTYQKNGDYSKAIRLYNDVLKIDHNNLASLYNLALIDTKQNKLKEAEQKLNKVLSLKKSHVLASLALGELYINQKKYDNAINALNKAIQCKPELVNPRLLKAKALQLKGNKKAAIIEYKEVLKYIPDQAEAKSSLNKLNK